MNVPKNDRDIYRTNATHTDGVNQSIANRNMMNMELTSARVPSPHQVFIWISLWLLVIRCFYLSQWTHFVHCNFYALLRFYFLLSMIPSSFDYFVFFTLNWNDEDEIKCKKYVYCNFCPHNLLCSSLSQFIFFVLDSPWIEFQFFFAESAMFSNHWLAISKPSTSEIVFINWNKSAGFIEKWNLICHNRIFKAIQIWMNWT